MAGVPTGEKCPDICCCSLPCGPPATTEPARGVRYRICDDIEECGRCTSSVVVTAWVGCSSSVVSSSSSVACCWRKLGTGRATRGSDVVEPLELLEPDLTGPKADQH